MTKTESVTDDRVFYKYKLRIVMSSGDVLNCMYLSAVSTTQEIKTFILRSDKLIEFRDWEDNNSSIIIMASKIESIKVMGDCA